MLSIATPLGPVTFPELRAERHYMVPFTLASGLPPHLKRWQHTVDQMLEGIRTDGKIFLMVDVGPVPAGKTLRRPGLHVDGHWIEGLHSHRGESPAPKHRGDPEPFMHGPFHYPEAIILASNVTGCTAYTGEFAYEGPFAGGDCSGVSTDGMEALVRQAGQAYAGNAKMLHESTPMPHDCMRAVVRLNVQGWEPALH